MKPVETLYFSAGTNLNWKYIDNQYLGDVVSENGIRSLGIYGFAQIKGSLGQFKEGTSRLTYVAGFGLSNQSYRQGDEEFSFGFVVRNSHWLIP